MPAFSAGIDRMAEKSPTVTGRGLQGFLARRGDQLFGCQPPPRVL